MTPRLLHPRVLAAGAALAAVYATCFAILASPQLAASPAVGAGVALDLTVTAAALVYLIAVRSQHLPPAAVGLVAIGGMIVAHRQLAGTPATSVVLAIGGAFEIGVVTLAAVGLWHIRRDIASGRASPLDALEAALGRAGLPRRLTAFVATELALLGHVLLGWRAPRRGAGDFTVHVEKGWLLYAGTFAALAAVETVGLHVVVHPHAPVLAWVLTALSLYGVLWIVGDALALRRGGVRIADDGLRIEIGVRWRARLRWSQIAGVERVAGAPAAAPDVVDASLLGANLVIQLSSPAPVAGPLGRRRSASRIALTVDDVDGVVAAVTARARGTAPPDPP